MIFEKPKYKKQKSKHITNQKLERGIICELCFNHEATETHEVFSGSNRNNSIKYGCQMKLCKTCHDNWHTKLTKDEKSTIKGTEQRRTMNQHNLTIHDFIKIFGRSWI